MHKEVDTDQAWLRVHQRLQSDGLIPREVKIVRMTQAPRRILSWTAAIFAIMAVGTLSYFLVDNFNAPRLLTLETGTDNSTFVQTLEDGSVVYVADNSVLSYPAIFSGDQRKVSLSGEAFFDIRSKSGQPFVIETNHALFEVIGTAFNLISNDDDFELIVEEGIVKVALRNMPANYEIVGEWEMLTGLSNIMEKSPVVDRTYLSWRLDRMQFRDERLGNIVSVISKNYNVNIDFENDVIRERRMTVTFHNNAINTIVEVIAFTLDLDYEILPDLSIMFRDKK